MASLEEKEINSFMSGTLSNTRILLCLVYWELVCYLELVLKMKI